MNSEKKGFEPSVHLREQLLSREPRSTTLAPLRGAVIFFVYCILFIFYSFVQPLYIEYNHLCYRFAKHIWVFN